MKMEEGYRLLDAGDLCLAADEANRRHGKPWQKLGDYDHGVGTDYKESDFADGYRYRRHITTELDNDLTKLAHLVSEWPKHDYRYAYLTANDGPNFTRNKVRLGVKCSEVYTLDQINEEKARWNLPMIEAEGNSSENPNSSEKAAVKTLEGMSYTWNGGELWKPPVGEAPDYIKDSSEWVPEAGDYCEACWLELPDGGSPSFKCGVYKGRFNDELWFGADGDGDIVRHKRDITFRPIETPEQKEARERDEWVSAMLSGTSTCDSFSDALELVYDHLKENKKL